MEPRPRDVDIFPYRGYATYPASLEYCEDLINMELVGDEFRCRRGYEKISDTGIDAGQSIRGAYLWAQHGIQGIGICIDNSGGVYKIEEDTLFTGGTWTPMASGMTLAVDSYPYFFKADLAASSSPIVIMCAAAQEPQQFCFTSSNLAFANFTMRQLDLMTDARPYMGCIYSQRVLLWGANGNVYYSDTANPFGTYLNNVKRIGNIQEKIIEIVPSNRGALIFKENSIWTVTGADFATSLPSLVMDSPVVGRRGVCRDKRGSIYFVNGRSVMRWGSPPDELSRNLEELFEVSETPYHSWLGYIYDKDQLLYLKDPRTADATQRVFDLAKGGFVSKATNYPFSCLHTVEAANREYPTATIAGTSLTSSRLYRLYNGVATDETTSISSLIQTKMDSFSSPKIEKTPRSLFLWGSTTNPIYVDFVYRDKDYNQFTVGITSSPLPAEIHFSPNLRNSSGNPINFVEASIKLHGQGFSVLKNIGFRFTEQREIFTR